MELLLRRIRMTKYYANVSSATHSSENSEIRPCFDSNFSSLRGWGLNPLTPCVFHCRVEKNITHIIIFAESFSGGSAISLGLSCKSRRILAADADIKDTISKFKKVKNFEIYSIMKISEKCNSLPFFMPEMNHKRIRYYMWWIGSRV